MRNFVAALSIFLSTQAIADNTLEDKTILGATKAYENSAKINKHCDIYELYTFLEIANRGLVVLAEHKLTKPAACDYLPVANQRFYDLTLKSRDGCESTTYVGKRTTANGTWKISIQNDRSRICDDKAPILVIEETSPQGVVKVMYSQK